MGRNAEGIESNSNINKTEKNPNVNGSTVFFNPISNDNKKSNSVHNLGDTTFGIKSK